ncbi:WAT1-related protein At1g68170-like [Telopea speciosissima]|uniref:WAT1-related protein At1g68170-like n=1 Tax=Telopea speciosissima TaxID=54955 RepID=UPI001CC43043|nr:WAT1-related protein At1g68170-like [Telopea speciosissima]
MVMVMVQAIFAGLNVFYKLATIDGMNIRIFMAYRYMFAFIFLAPFAFFIERKRRPKLTWMVAFQAFLCGFFGGTLAQNLYVLSLSLTSMTFAAAMTNLVPAITYLLAVILRMERLGIKTIAGKAKLVGSAIGIGGAMVLTFYKGHEVIIWSTNIDLTRGLGNAGATTHAAAGNRALGSILAFGCCWCHAIWMIVQTKLSERYPCPLSSTALMCLMGSVQNVILAICVDQKWEEWKLGWNIGLLTVAYSGILASGVTFTLIAWGVRARGPLFVSIFNPLMLLMVAIMGSLFLAEKLYVGSLVGAALIVVGLYGVLWGKGKEMKRMSLVRRPSQDDGEPIEGDGSNGGGGGGGGGGVGSIVLFQLKKPLTTILLPTPPKWGLSPVGFITTYGCLSSFGGNTGIRDNVYTDNHGFLVPRGEAKCWI